MKNLFAALAFLLLAGISALAQPTYTVSNTSTSCTYEVCVTFNCGTNRACVGSTVSKQVCHTIAPGTSMIFTLTPPAGYTNVCENSLSWSAKPQGTAYHFTNLDQTTVDYRQGACGGCQCPTTCYFTIWTPTGTNSFTIREDILSSTGCSD